MPVRNNLRETLRVGNVLRIVIFWIAINMNPPPFCVLVPAALLSDLSKEDLDVEFVLFGSFPSKNFKLLDLFSIQGFSIALYCFWS